jgi:hypothetical protein
MGAKPGRIGSKSIQQGEDYIWEKLPEDVILYIFSFVTYRDVLALSECSKFLFNVTSQDKYWFPLCKE